MTSLRTINRKKQVFNATGNKPKHKTSVTAVPKYFNSPGTEKQSSDVRSFSLGEKLSEHGSFSRLYSKLASNQSIQPKLTVNQPGDRYEKEADEVADRIMRMEEHGEAPVHGAAPGIQRKCTECEKEEEELQLMPITSNHTSLIQRQSSQEFEGKGKIIQTKVDGGVPSITHSFKSQLNSSKGGGIRMPPATHRFMSNAFGHDLSHVRIHNNAMSHKMNQNIHARAFTHGSDIYFSKGQYSPDSSKGKKLLAHELTHVVQQQGGKETRVHEVTRTIQQRNVVQRQPNPGSSSPPVEINVDPQTVEIILNLADTARHQIQARGQLTQPLNVLGDVTGVPLAIPRSTLDVSILYNNRCNQAVQNIFARLQQQQARGQNVFDFSQANWSVSAGGGFRVGDLLIEPSGQASFTGDSFSALNFVLTFTPGVSEAIPEACKNQPNPRPGAGANLDLCAGIECNSRPSPTDDFLTRHLRSICCIGIPNVQPSPSQLLPQTVYFFYDKPVFKPQSNDTLSLILLGLQIFPTAHILVTGHTSLEGTEAYNQRLAQSRAEAVRTYMQLQGIDANRVQVMSMGEFSPAVSEPPEPQRGALRIPRNEQIRDLNRRAEVTFYDPSGTIDFLPTMAPMLPTPSLSIEGFSHNRFGFGLTF